MTTLTVLADIALQDAREAREDLTAEEGIGAELLPTLYAWDTNNQLIGTASIKRQNDDIYQQQTAILAGIRIIREGWQATTIALLAEAYTSKKGDNTLTLAERFATDPDVHECLTLVAVNDEGEALIAVQPFTAGLGRTINWHEDELTPIQATDSPNANLMYATLISAPEQPTKPERTPQTAIEALMRLGYTYVEYQRPSSN